MTKHRLDSERRLELWERLCQLSVDLQSIVHFWWQLDRELQCHLAPEPEERGDSDGKMHP